MHSSNPGFKPNQHWNVCQLCGLDYRVEDMRTTWDNKLVCKYDYEPRHPQDIIRGVEDDTSTVGIATGEPNDKFVADTPLPAQDSTIPTFNNINSL